MRVAVLFGGRSAEHEVSIVSARGVLAAMDRDRFEPAPFGITLEGELLTPGESLEALAAAERGELRALAGRGGRGLLARPEALAELASVNVAFPLVHGPNGEDGTMQGFLELARLPYAGAGVEASAIGLDKALMKDAFRQQQLPVAPYVVLEPADLADTAAAIAIAQEATGFPCFVKPANGGSSIGISKVHGEEELGTALTLAGRYDRTIVIETAITGREIECAVLGNDAPEASPPGEIVPDREFYDYESKYSADSRTQLLIPAPLDGPLAGRVRELAIRAFRAIGCSGMARVDFFLTPGGDLYVNEINTIPGFTPISMYPKLWAEAGLTYTGLISRLIDLALERHEERERYAEAYATARA